MRRDERHMDTDLWTLGLEIVYADFIWNPYVLNNRKILKDAKRRSFLTEKKALTTTEMCRFEVFAEING